MSNEIFVILFDGNPHRKDGAIRTYKTRERAEKEARALKPYQWYRDRKTEVGVFSAEQLTEVTVEQPVSPPIPYAPYTEGVTAE
ncbi:hypothetical protein [Paenibacillus graminis]|uniref:hypothetical protein n=1 Tax=Paenibacillus graminis TaxID=189425 RepID=UPI002DBDFEF2|nr:hypothetical protein [Paenibacillus graminis]MEC0167889.1 hypothetical protein [Paenibacillus graminis]